MHTPSSSGGHPLNQTDVLIVGSGCSGLYTALNLPRHLKITLITKAGLTENDSYLAQGGICMLRDDSDFDAYFADTLRAGHGENDRSSVTIMIRDSKSIIEDLVGYGVTFARNADGSFCFTREGAHSQNRILFHEDITGREITSHLLTAVQALPNVTLMPHTTLLDIVEDDGTCAGGILLGANGKLSAVAARHTVLACGGIGGLYPHSTNFHHLTGDALAIALHHHVALKNIDYVQIHPTTLYTPNPEERSFLISESVRGEGALLYDKNGRRFVDELLPRDKLTQAIHAQMRKDQTPFVWEDLRPIPTRERHAHFPNIIAHCAEHGYDVDRECIPVVPAQHYFMGGVAVNYESATSMPQLYAVGETACNGVHGRNRLASNSLLESLVFARRAARDISVRTEAAPSLHPFNAIDWDHYADSRRLEENNHEQVKLAINRVHARCTA